MNEKIEKTKQNVVEFARKAKDEAKQAGSNVVRFAVDNKELLLASIPVVVAIARTGQSVMVNRRVRNERKRILRPEHRNALGSETQGIERRPGGDPAAQS